MKKLFLGCGCLFMVIALAIGGGGYLMWQSVQQLPPDAKRETLFAAHRSLIDQLDAAIRAATSFSNAAERIAAISTDPKIVYVKLSESGGTQQLDVVKRVTWEGNSTMIWNGAGAGTLRTKFGTQDIRIIQSSERTTDGMLLEYTVYVAHGELTEITPAPVPAPASPAPTPEDPAVENPR